mmetsp:Transcript_61060/g.175174  ORF Transcript_61060/g.175174 Transcript_61060/m.175174 type:complete len:205 (-) Transcript_61060:550-1164(-)
MTQYPLLDCVLVRAHGPRASLQGQNVTSDAYSPDVAFLIVGTAKHLGRHVRQGAADVAQLLALLKCTGQPKVYELQGCVLASVHQHVVGEFDVAMHEPVVVHVRDACQHLPEVAGNQIPRQAIRYCRTDHPPLGPSRALPIVHQIIPQVAASTEVHDQIQVLILPERLTKCDDVGVAETLEDLQLTLEALGVDDALNIDDLDGI